MAETAVETTSHLTRKLWDEKTIRDVVKETYFGSKESTKGDTIVHLKNDFMKNSGDVIKHHIRMRLNSAPTAIDDEMVEGNEEALTSYGFETTLHLYRKGVRDKGELHRKRSVMDIDAESKLALQDWGSEYLDLLKFEALGLTSDTTNESDKVFYLNSSAVLTSGSAATAKAALHATNSKPTLAAVSKIKTWCITGGNRARVPLRPVKIKGKSYLVYLTHNDTFDGIWNSSEWQQALREAESRGSEHPLFQGAMAITTNGVIVHAHENVHIGTDGGGASVAWSKGLVMGAQALVAGFGRKPQLVPDTFDYKNKNGYCWGVTYATKKPIFNSLDYGSVGFWTARDNVSGL